MKHVAFTTRLDRFFHSNGTARIETLFTMVSHLATDVRTYVRTYMVELGCEPTCVRAFMRTDANCNTRDGKHTYAEKNTQLTDNAITTTLQSAAYVDPHSDQRISKSLRRAYVAACVHAYAHACAQSRGPCGLWCSIAVSSCVFTYMVYVRRTTRAFLMKLCSD